MSGRRGGNQIRGPQSALTDFLAANNISAGDIRRSHENRRQQAERQQQQQQQQNASNASSNNSNGDDADNDNAAAATHNIASSRSSRSRPANDEEEQSEQVSTLAIRRASSIKTSKKEKEKGLQAKKKAAAKKAGRKSGKGGEDDDDAAYPGYEKSRPLPGQFEHCETCSKRFTVTPYSREGPEGGLLCTPCGKIHGKNTAASKTAAPKSVGRKRRKIESERLDGMVGGGAKSLQLICIEKLAKHHEDIEELGDISQAMLNRLSQIFSKRRVLRSKTLPLFLRPDHGEVTIHDAAYLEVDDYKQICGVVPQMTKLVLGNACQFKDEVVEYMVERCKSIRYLQLYAANLVTDAMWLKLFKSRGQTLEVVKLKWLDASFSNDVVATMVQSCPNLERLKLELCRKLDDEAIVHISRIPKLKHISLSLNNPVTNESLVDLIHRRGASLETLSLRQFIDADDLVLQTIHDNCRRLQKLRISGNDTATDAAYTALFTSWSNYPLTHADFNSTRDIDNNNPDGPDEHVGLASDGFRALMAHSGSMIKHLDIASCRHITLRAFTDVFNGARLYPFLENINISFCNRADTSVVAGIFKSCPSLKKLVAFGCFDIHDVVVPRNIALIGIPKAQDAIEQYGVGIGVEEAIDRMIDVGA